MVPRALFLSLLVCGLAVAQTRPSQPPSQPSQPGSGTRGPGTSRNADQEPPGDATTPLNSPAKLLKYQHEEVLKDIDKLSKLVTEIQEELNKAGENVLPLSTLKKLDEVEKLAKKVRGRLKQ